MHDKVGMPNITTREIHQRPLFELPESEESPVVLGKSLDGSSSNGSGGSGGGIGGGGGIYGIEPDIRIEREANLGTETSTIIN